MFELNKTRVKKGSLADDVPSLRFHVNANAQDICPSIYLTGRQQWNQKKKNIKIRMPRLCLSTSGLKLR